jgi:hypothetical protein
VILTLKRHFAGMTSKLEENLAVKGSPSGGIIGGLGLINGVRDSRQLDLGDFAANRKMFNIPNYGERRISIVPDDCFLGTYVNLYEEGYLSETAREAIPLMARAGVPLVLFEHKGITTLDAVHRQIRTKFIDVSKAFQVVQRHQERLVDDVTRHGSRYNRMVMIGEAIQSWRRERSRDWSTISYFGRNKAGMEDPIRIFADRLQETIPSYPSQRISAEMILDVEDKLQQTFKKRKSKLLETVKVTRVEMPQVEGPFSSLARFFWEPQEREDHITLSRVCTYSKQMSKVFKDYMSLFPTLDRHFISEIKEDLRKFAASDYATLILAPNRLVSILQDKLSEHPN